MKRVTQAVFILVLIVGAVMAWRILFPGPVVKIRKQMTALQELVTFSGTEGNLAKLAASRELGGLFAEDAEIRLDVQGGPHGTIRGRDNIIQASLGARQVIGGLKVEFLDLAVSLGADGHSAVVETTGKAVPKGSGDLWVQELRFRFVETEAGWMITSVETVRTLTRAGIHSGLAAGILGAA